MNILLGFAPYIAFFLFMQAVSIDAGLWAALIVALLIAGRNWRRSGSLKVFGKPAPSCFLRHWSSSQQRNIGNGRSWQSD
jgi:hypothetical protein